MLFTVDIQCTCGMNFAVIFHTIVFQTTIIFFGNECVQAIQMFISIKDVRPFLEHLNQSCFVSGLGTVVEFLWLFYQIYTVNLTQVCWFVGSVTAKLQSQPWHCKSACKQQTCPHKSILLGILSHKGCILLLIVAFGYTRGHLQV